MIIREHKLRKRVFCSFDMTSRSCSKRKRNNFESSISAYLESLDKGRLSLGFAAFVA